MNEKSSAVIGSAGASAILDIMFWIYLIKMLNNVNNIIINQIAAFKHNFCSMIKYFVFVLVYDRTWLNSVWIRRCDLYSMLYSFFLEKKSQNFSYLLKPFLYFELASRNRFSRSYFHLISIYQSIHYSVIVIGTHDFHFLN